MAKTLFEEVKQNAAAIWAELGAAYTRALGDVSVKVVDTIFDHPRRVKVGVIVYLHDDDNCPPVSSLPGLVKEGFPYPSHHFDSSRGLAMLRERLKMCAFKMGLIKRAAIAAQPTGKEIVCLQNWPLEIVLAGESTAPGLKLTESYAIVVAESWKLDPPPEGK